MSMQNVSETVLPRPRRRRIEPRMIVCKAIFSLAEPDPPRLHDILKAVSEETRIGIGDIVSPSRRDRITRARAIYFAVAHAMTSKSLCQIAFVVRRKDHTTVRHGVLTVRAAQHRYEPEYSTVIARLSRVKISGGGWS